MTTEALELEVERAWVALANLYGLRTLYLTSTNRLRWGWVADRAHEVTEVGTYTRAVPLQDFREDVFFAYEQSTGRRRA